MRQLREAVGGVSREYHDVTRSRVDALLEMTTKQVGGGWRLQCGIVKVGLSQVMSCDPAMSFGQGILKTVTCFTLLLVDGMEC